MKRLCGLNNCSDCDGNQYPECDMKRDLPSVCPKREVVRALFPKYSDLDVTIEELDKKLDKVRRLASTEGGIPNLSAGERLEEIRKIVERKEQYGM